ncbi:pRiA4b ORF-3-like protein [Gracilibacillus ureilyticus]|uniref:PRiA4b ORF-3-like protein n=1 Tax=Gracilibacillus ureilyticus TaxID=531814 RepID=A0A1H9W0S5_9BACI|nr:plasmid pRiA4b ORF-3 family protein [Gracilibacillus ureilyticus]SES27389.1 pRiA4b ORF-3-like protein [Gracilibacillus ureilyticus]
MPLQLRIMLEKENPPVWRRILIDESVTFEQLHEVIQVLFDWDNVFWYTFRGTDESGETVIIKPAVDELLDMAGIDSDEIQIGSFFQQPDRKIKYTYDLEKEWIHEIVLEKILPSSPYTYPICMDAKGNAPEESGLLDVFFEGLDELSEQELLETINSELIEMQEYFHYDANEPFTEEWTQLFNWVDKFKQLKPWNYLHDGQVIAVWSESIQEYVYFSVMGNAGIHYGITCYIGNKGFISLLSTIEQQELDELTILLNQRAVTLNLLNRNELEEEEYQLIKSIGRTYRGNNQWPAFHSLVPGYYVWRPDKEEVHLLLEVYPLLLNVLKRVTKGKLMIPGGLENWYALTKDQNGDWIDSTLSVEKQYKEATKSKEIQLEVSELEVARIKKQLPRKKQNLEVAVIPFPEPVQEHQKARPFFPFLYLVVDAQSGLVLYQDMIRMDESIATKQDILMSTIEKLSAIPHIIYMDDPILAEELAPVAEKLRIQIEFVDKLKNLETVVEELLEIMDPANENNLPF